MDMTDIERFLLRAWPALAEEPLDGWLLRFAGGYTKRSNSVAVLGPSGLPLADKVHQCEAAYASRGLPAIFKLGDYSPDVLKLDALLAERGYALVDECLVLGLDLAGEDGADGMESQRCQFESCPESAEMDFDAWLAAHARLAGLADPERHRRIIENIRVPIMHAALLRNGHVAACGLAVCEPPLAAIFDLVVRPDLRGQGLGKTLSRAMLAWAARNGARQAVLQVIVRNGPAMALYGSLGFVPLYRYWYRKEETGRS